MLSNFMKSNIAITVEGLSKKYKIGRKQKYLTFRETLPKLLKLPFRYFQKTDKQTEFWALSDVSFEVKRGDVVGIIGKNGAGKSTLLKIISRITLPTKGQVKLSGRIASLLEVGTGFSAELTGRENIYLNGSILGMSRKEIKQKFDQIVDFSGVGKFLDTPVKRYSSGMYVRLAFAIAAHLDPEILVIDEVLAVGDAKFQKKCLGKMRDIASGGRTVLFVSHNMSAVQNLCNSTILLNNGRIDYYGRTRKAIEKYLDLNDSNSESNAEYTYPLKPKVLLQIREIKILNHRNEANINLDINNSFSIQISYDVNEDINNANHLALLFYKYSPDDPIVNIFDIDTNRKLYKKRTKGKYIATFRFPANIFNWQEIKVCITLNAIIADKHFFDKKENIPLHFTDTSSFATRFYKGRRGGQFLLKIPCEVKKVNSDTS
jgi:homopolymeric O-antigen transport system ATP-binding protein